MTFQDEGIFIPMNKKKLLALDWIASVQGMNPEDFISENIKKLLEFYLVEYGFEDDDDEKEMV
ncbi:MAG: hypothetical protein ACFFAS_07180 [Promethearchaeota archaeon]